MSFQKQSCDYSVKSTVNHFSFKWHSCKEVVLKKTWQQAYSGDVKLFDLQYCMALYQCTAFAASSMFLFKRSECVKASFVFRPLSHCCTFFFSLNVLWLLSCVSLFLSATRSVTTWPCASFIHKSLACQPAVPNPSLRTHILFLTAQACIHSAWNIPTHTNTGSHLDKKTNKSTYLFPQFLIILLCIVLPNTPLHA